MGAILAFTVFSIFGGEEESDQLSQISPCHGQISEDLLDHEEDTGLFF